MRLRRCVSANRKTIGCAPRFAAARLSSGRGRVELISAALGAVAISFSRLLLRVKPAIKERGA